METSPDGWVLSDKALQKVVKAVRQQLAAPLNRPDQRNAKGGFGPHDVRSVTNNTGETLQPRSVVQIDTPSVAVLSGSDLQQIVSKVVKATTAYTKLYGISVGSPSTNGDGSLVSLTGGLVAYTGTQPVEGKSVGPVPASFSVSSTAPPYFTVVGISTAEGLCEVVPFQSPVFSPVTLSAPLVSNGSVNVTLSDGRVVSGQNKAGQTIAAGPAICGQDQFDGSYYITGSAVPSTVGSTAVGSGPRFYDAQLLLDLAYADTSGQVDPNSIIPWDAGSTVSFTDVGNPYKWIGLAGNQALIMDAPANANGYIIIEVENHPQREYKGTLNSALASTSTSASITGVTGLDGLPAPSTAINASNLMRWSGQSGWNCLLTDDWSSGSQAYILRHVQFVDTKVQLDTTFNSTSLVVNYQTIPLPLGSGSTTVTVFATTVCST